MSKRTVKTRWAGKLLRSKHFIVLTDKESVICLQGVDPADINDFLMLQAQTAELQDFSDKLKELIGYHNSVMRKLRGDKSDTTEQTTGKRKRPRKIQG